MIAYHDPPLQDFKAHYLKIDPNSMDFVAPGVKTAELQENDRNFQVHDHMALRSESATVITEFRTGTRALYGAPALTIHH